MRYRIALVALLLSACSSPAPAPEDHFYRLPAITPDETVQLTDGTLLVEPLHVTGLIRERSIVYVNGRDGIEIERYHYHLWYEAPAFMLQQHLADYLRLAAVADSVVTSKRLTSEVVVTGTIHEFMHIRGENDNQVVVRLELMLKKNDGAGTYEQRMYTEYETVNGNQMTAVVAAFGRALARVYDEFLSAAARMVL